VVAKINSELFPGRIFVAGPKISCMPVSTIRGVDICLLPFVLDGTYQVILFCLISTSKHFVRRSRLVYKNGPLFWGLWFPLRSGGFLQGREWQNNPFSGVTVGLWQGRNLYRVSIYVSNIHSIWLVVAGRH
jgi:hypothetical protein